MTQALFPHMENVRPPFVRIVVASVEGSAPREAGAAMLVARESQHGTIGGGALEFESIAHARSMLQGAGSDDQWLRDTRSWPLGPALGQCCGGAVRILFERFGASELNALSAESAPLASNGILLRSLETGSPCVLVENRKQARAMALPVAGIVSDMLSGARQRQSLFISGAGLAESWFIEPLDRTRIPLFLYGAGHVGRAIVKIVSDLNFDLHWIDTHADRFPQDIPAGVKCVPASQPERIAVAAPPDAFHLVLTYSHAIDLGICHALLAEPDFGFLGLIGSQTKRTRFLKRLGERGVAPQALARLTCPIGAGSLLGKEPATIAVSVAGQLLQLRETLLQQSWQGLEGDNGAGKRISA